jgi:hypothetical protein
MHAILPEYNELLWVVNNVYIECTRMYMFVSIYMSVCIKVFTCCLAMLCSPPLLLLTVLHLFDVCRCSSAKQAIAAYMIYDEQYCSTYTFTSTERFGQGTVTVLELCASSSNTTTINLRHKLCCSSDRGDHYIYVSRLALCM